MGGTGSRLKKIPDRVYKRLGNTATVTQVVASSVYDVDTGTYPTVKTPNVLRCGVSNYLSNEIISGVINITDMKLTVPSKDFDITKQWEVEYRGDVWSIMNIGFLDTDDERIYYELQVRA